MNSANGQYAKERVLKEISQYLNKEGVMRVYFLLKGKKLDYSFKQERWDLPREGDKVSIYKQSFQVVSRIFDYDEAEIQITLEKITYNKEKGI